MQGTPTIVERYSDHEDFMPRVEAIVRALSEKLGFIPLEEVQRRTIYDANKVWRVKLRGTWNNRIADLKIDGMSIGVEEFRIREAFARAQTDRVRPPIVYACEPFEATRGYGYMLEEGIEAPSLFRSGDDPDTAAKAFTEFCRELRRVLEHPFLKKPDMMQAAQFTQKQFESWFNVARGVAYSWFEEYREVAESFAQEAQHLLTDRELEFMHPHLSGADVQRTSEGVYIVHANHFWGWRQPMYDVVFPMWGQWLAISATDRGRGRVLHITQTWRRVLERELGERFDAGAWRAAVLNRVYGSLLLDVPAIARREGESLESVYPLMEELRHLPSQL